MYFERLNIMHKNIINMLHDYTYADTYKIIGFNKLITVQELNRH